ncbi:hypothetical protein SAMN04488020_109176 [Palleronia marisminoris]|nr:hypothetical protein [Palleronia marisminoris]SFH29812.1 hypothetical protein SAMN04488020_109176 [Palleronia marisminoris]
MTLTPKIWDIQVSHASGAYQFAEAAGNGTVEDKRNSKIYHAAEHDG